MKIFQVIIWVAKLIVFSALTVLFTEQSHIILATAFLAVTILDGSLFITRIIARSLQDEIDDLYEMINKEDK